jgi:hypothetical protein
MSSISPHHSRPRDRSHSASSLPHASTLRRHSHSRERGARGRSSSTRGRSRSASSNRYTLPRAHSRSASGNRHALARGRSWSASGNRHTLTRGRSRSASGNRPAFGHQRHHSRARDRSHSASSVPCHHGNKGRDALLTRVEKHLERNMRRSVPFHVLPIGNCVHIVVTNICLMDLFLTLSFDLGYLRILVAAFDNLALVSVSI